MAVKSNNRSFYGLSQPLISDVPEVIRTNVSPTARDMADEGTIWINHAAGTRAAWINCGNAGNAANWSPAAALVAPVVIAGNATVAGTSTLTGLVTMTAGVTGALVTDADVTVGTSLDVTTTATIGTGLTVTAGGATITAGDLTITTDDLVLTAGNIDVAAGDIDLTQGDVTLIDGDLILSTATNHIVLPGPVKIMSGAGAPANGLAAAAGDMYIRTDPAGAASRLYIATAANTWTNVTCAA